MKPEKSIPDSNVLPLGVVQHAVDTLFLYLHDVLYSSKAAVLEPEQLPEPFRELARGLLFIGESIDETRALANDLARGTLNSPKISVENEIASGLKNLQATLKHITWQAGQVAKGDYRQQLRFSGALSESINDMIAQLRERDDALHREIETNQQLAADARDTVLLLEGITKSISEWIIVVDRTNLEWLYSNHEASDFLSNEQSVEQLKGRLSQEIGAYYKEAAAHNEATPPLQSVIELMDGEESCEDSRSQFFSVTGYVMTWMERKSVVFILQDVTSEQQEREKLERFAYFDALTGARSRYYGMAALERMQNEKNAFVLAFVDMDNLKYVNDTFGHSAGDEYILATSRVLFSFDKQVIISRLGGDEFMLLCKNMTAEEVQVRLEELRTQFARSFNGEYERTFSFGLAEAGEQSTMSASLLLSTADENMYEDKRNRKKKRRTANDRLGGSVL